MGATSTSAPWPCQEPNAEEWARELRFAARVQETLLGRRTATVPGMVAFGQSVPQFAVGGDCFDLIPLPEGGLRIVIADIMGKGFGAAMLMAMFRSAARIVSAYGTPPGKTLCQLNEYFYPDLQKLESFLTVACADYHPDQREVVLASAGHPYPLLLRPNSRHQEPVKVRGVSLAMLPAATYREVCLPVSDGDRLLFYTDGLVEARNAEGQEYAIRGLTSAFSALGHLEAPEIVEGLLGAVASFTRPCSVRDDVTLVVTQFGPVSEGP